MTVYITGVGLVCPAGVGLDESLERLKSGSLEATPDLELDPNGHLPLRFVVPESFNPKDYIKRRKDLKLMARANRLAVAAAVLAADAAKIDGLDHEDTGVFLAVGREPGNIDDILPAVHHSHAAGAIDLTRLGEEGVGWMNPLSSLKTLPNMSLAHVGIRLDIMGPAWTLCSEPESGLQILFEAVQQIEDGSLNRVVVGGADSRVSFPDRVSMKREGLSGPVGEAAVVFILESETALAESQAKPLAVIKTTQYSTEPTKCPFGHCGAATHLVNAALAVGAGRAYAFADLEVAQPTTRPSAPTIIHRRKRPPVAITDVGLVTPLGSRFEQFRDNLLAGVSAVSPIQAFCAESFPVKNACEVADFDPALQLPGPLYHQVRDQSDRRLELGLAAAMQILNQADGDPADDLIFGTGLSSVSCQELAEDCIPYLIEDGGFDYPRLARDAGALNRQAPRRHQVARLTQLLKNHGSIRRGACHFSACAAAAAAIGHGADRITTSLSKSVLAGGCDSMVHPFGLIPFILLGATSREVNPERAGRPFDSHRDGFVMGEAGVFLKLESDEIAQSDGRRIYGYILGWGSSCDAHNVTAPHPDGRGAELSMRRALANAQITPSEVDYINAHGTGTQLNDVIEAAAIERIFGTDSPPVSSSKGQFGHAIAAAGAIEALAALASFSGDQLPPNAHLVNPDPDIRINLVPSQGQKSTPRIILSNSFGFGGQNVSLVLGHPEGFP